MMRKHYPSLMDTENENEGKRKDKRRKDEKMKRDLDYHLSSSSDHHSDS